MAKWYEWSIVKWFRLRAEERLKDVPPAKDKNETAEAFWARVEKAGRLIEALELYDQIAEGNAKGVHLPRETKKIFAERIEREGRRADVERMRSELLAQGRTLREIHTYLVNRFQPLDGSRTRPWETPDPWENGRLFRKKEDQNRFVAEIEGYDEHDYCPNSRWRYEWKQMHREKGLASSNAKWRVDCAKWRRDERIALANARRRALELKAAATKLAEAKAKEAAAQAKGQKKAKSQKKAGAADDEPKVHGKWIVVDAQGHMKWVPDAKT